MLHLPQQRSLDADTKFLPYDMVLSRQPGSLWQSIEMLAEFLGYFSALPKDWV